MTKQDWIIPSWADAMVNNYRLMYAQRYKMETAATDEQIWEICNTVFDDDSNTACDAARVEAIHDLA